VSDFYRMDPGAWDFGTASLSLEEEAAYLRIVNAIHKHKGPVPDQDRVLAGLFRVSTRKARALVKALQDAGKVTIEDGLIFASDEFEPCGPETRTAIPTHVKDQVTARDGLACRYCGSGSDPLEYDHVLPWSRGGQHTLENLVVACRPCNRAKKDRTPSEMGWQL